MSTGRTRAGSDGASQPDVCSRLLQVRVVAFAAQTAAVAARHVSVSDARSAAEAPALRYFSQQRMRW